MVANIARRLLVCGVLASVAAGFVVAPGCNGRGDTVGESGADPQRVEIEVAASGYLPAKAEADAGRPLVLVFRRTTEESCGATVVIPSLAIQRELPLNEAVEIALPAQRAGTVDFACAMDMMHGSIVVR
jgi:Cu+-exporting ATPase